MPLATDAVWLSVLPDMKGFGPALAKGADSEAEKAGKSAGGKFGKAALAATALIAGGAVLATKALYNIGETFDEMTDTIRVGTGATGKQLDALTNSARNVGKRVPADFKDVGAAIADVNTRLGLSGKPLEDLSAQFLELSRITGTDVSTNIKTVSRVFGDWGVATKDQSSTMDYLFKVSQTTGIGIDQLAQSVVQFGAPLRQMGFDLESSAAMLGKWEKEGVNTNAVLAGMKIGLGEFSKAGKDPVKAMAAVEKAIMNAGSAGKANQLAIETFGQRAGPDMAAAIREGRFDLDALMSTLKGSKETIMGAGKDTMDFSEQWLLFKNQAMIGLEPLATRVFGAIGTGMEWIRTTGVPAMRDLVFWVKENATWLAPLGAAVAAVVVAIGAWAAATRIAAAAQAAWNLVMAANPIGIVVVALAALVAGLVVAYKTSDTFREVVDNAWSSIKAAVSTAWNNVIKPALAAFKNFITDTLIPAVKRLWENVIRPTFEAIGKAISWAWSNVIKPAFSAWKAYLDNVLFPVLRFLWSNVVKPVFNSVQTAIEVAWGVIRRVFQAWKSYFDNVLFPVVRFLWDKVVRPVMTQVGDKIRTVWENVIRPVFEALRDFIGDKIAPAFKKGVDAIGRIWEGLKKAASAPVRFVVDTVYNKGIVKVVNAIPGVDDLSPVKVNFANGGVMPGYTPGRDVHRFYSPTAGRLDLSGGEAVMRPEWTKAVGGPKAVERMNKAARRGVYHFANGGVFRPVPFGSPGGLHGANGVDVGVPVGTPVAAAASGRVTASYDIPGYEPRAPHGGLGYRSYGRVIKIGHGAFSTLYAHLSGRAVRAGTPVAGGQVIGVSGNTGYSTGPHLHFEAHGANPYAFFNGSTNYSGVKASGSLDAGSGGFNLPDPLRFLNLDTWKDKLGGMGDWGKMLGQMVGSVVGGFKDWATDKVGSLLGFGDGAAPPNGPVREMLTTAARQRGWGGQLGALFNLIQNESGFNPNAQNPSSTAYGLFQFLDSTWAGTGVAKTSNPAMQIVAGMRYIAQRYTDPNGAWSFWQRNHWYKDGGVIPQLFDAGGWMMPGSVGVNLSSKPEPVFTDAQWATLRAVTQSSLSGDRMGGRSSSLVAEVSRMRVELGQRLERVERAAGVTGPDRTGKALGVALNGAAASAARRPR